MKTIRVTIEGTVQNVFFREYTRRKAEELNLRGWVRNVPDGSVESVITGDNESLETMVSWFHQGSPHSKVRQVTVEESSDTLKDTTFRILF